MRERYCVFTERDHKQLESYIPIMECLGSMFGDYCEVVLHSFEDLNSSIIHIVNGQVTGREIGAPVTNVALEKISRFTENDEKWDVYHTGEGDISSRKSASVLLTNDDQQPIGMLCINYSLDIPLYEFMNAMLNTRSGHKQENFTNDVNGLVLSHLKPIKSAVHSNNNIPSKNKVFAIVKRLYEEGMFDLPITIKLVSQELSISSATIYKHLRVIKRNDLQWLDT
ncbi:PAS domain-containing protein [Vibrio sp. SA48]|uniref:helix-turn-helix transcriptional regulator n=1 Tax=Vibrio sp. S12_S33 TaxID=2720223 RepID=UPI0017868585|nr:PAS domain-containing protein [Vibrio sp. S12_S33]MBD1567273.1 DNA-binding protein [Vibrio sp. S12_S33]